MYFVVNAVYEARFIRHVYMYRLSRSLLILHKLLSCHSIKLIKITWLLSLSPCYLTLEEKAVNLELDLDLGHPAEFFFIFSFLNCIRYPIGYLM